MKKWLLIVFAAILVVKSASLWAEEGKLTVEQVHQAIMAEQNTFTVIDVRSPEEFAEGHVPRAINIPHKEITQHLAMLKPLEKNGLVLHCRSGYRAGVAMSALKEAGFTNLKHMDGDWKGWQAAGYPEAK